MNAVSNLIRTCYENGWSETIYTFGLVLSYVGHIIFLLFYRKKYGISAAKALLTLAILFPLVYYWMLVLSWADNGFKDWGVNNIVRVFAWVPLFGLLAAKILKVEPSKMLDFIAPSFAMQQAISHTVCPFAGCCNGYPCSWGIWNPFSESPLFPCQWLECLVSLLIMLVLLRIAKKSDYDCSGKLFPLFLTLFGGTRFFLEFLRDNNKLFLGISDLAIHALFMVLVGVVWLLIRRRRQTPEKAPV